MPANFPRYSPDEPGECADKNPKDRIRGPNERTQEDGKLPRVQHCRFHGANLRWKCRDPTNKSQGLYREAAASDKCTRRIGSRYPSLQENARLGKPHSWRSMKQSRSKSGQAVPALFVSLISLYKAAEARNEESREQPPQTDHHPAEPPQKRRSD